MTAKLAFDGEGAPLKGTATVTAGQISDQAPSPRFKPLLGTGTASLADGGPGVFEPIHGTKVWDYLVVNLQQNAKQFGEGQAAFTLPKSDNLMNALAWDPKRKALLI